MVVQLRTAMAEAGLSIPELWLRYFALGGVATLNEVSRHIYQGDVLGDVQHDVLVLALNERFGELDLDHPVPYLRTPAR